MRAAARVAHGIGVASCWIFLSLSYRLPLVDRIPARLRAYYSVALENRIWPQDRAFFRRTWFREEAPMQYPEVLDRAACYAFEDEIRGLVEAFGYIAETTKPSGDFGADVVGWHGGKKVIVQCKLYTRGKIGNKVIGELEGTRRFYDATHAVIVTTSSFTKPAREMAEKIGIYLIDREALIQLCRQKRITIPSATYLTPFWDGVAFGVADITAHKLPQAGEFTVGRAVENDLVIQDIRISRHHSIIMRRGLRLTIADCGSANGTRVNGQRLTEDWALNYGDRVTIGTALSMEVALSA